MPTDAAVAERLEIAARTFRDPRGQDREAHLDSETPAVIQLRKACRLLDAARSLQEHDGYHTSVVELAFGAIERSIQSYAMANADDAVEDFWDHATVYERGGELNLYSNSTADELVELWRTNRSAAYYRNTVATAEQAAALVALAEALHRSILAFGRATPHCVCSTTE